MRKEVRWVALATAVLTCGLGSRALALRKAPPRLVETLDHRLYLYDGGERKLLGDFEPEVVKRAGGWELTIDPSQDLQTPTATIRRNGSEVAKLDLLHLRDEWLKRDALWGPGKAGNQMRYMHQSGGGVCPVLNQVHATSKGWVGVLSWRFSGPSGKPVGPEHLIRISATNPPAMEPVRLLDTTRDGSNPLGPTVRTFEYGGKLLLWEPGALYELGPKGELQRRFMAVPRKSDQEPRLAVGSRWLVLTPSRSADRRELTVDVIDLQRKTVRMLIRERASEMDGVELRDATDQPPSLLAENYRAGQRPSLFVISILDGKRRKIATNWAGNVTGISRNYLITFEADGKTRFYDRRTLAQEKRLKLPGK